MDENVRLNSNKRMRRRGEKKDEESMNEDDGVFFVTLRRSPTADEFKLGYSVTSQINCPEYRTFLRLRESRVDDSI